MIKKIGQTAWRDIFVVCQTKTQYENLIVAARIPWDFEIKHKMVHFVEDASDLNGIPPSRVFLFGSYFKRRDWQRIEESILANKHMKLKCR